MSHLKKEIVEDLEQAVRDNEERQRKEQMMASTLQKLNADDMLSDDDIEHVSKSGIVSVPKALSIPETIVTTFSSPSKPSGSETSEQQPTEPQEPSKPYEETSKVFETFGNQYWD